MTAMRIPAIMISQSLVWLGQADSSFIVRPSRWRSVVLDVSGLEGTNGDRTAAFEVASRHLRQFGRASLDR